MTRVSPEFTTFVRCRDVSPWRARVSIYGGKVLQLLGLARWEDYMFALMCCGRMILTRETLAQWADIER